MTKFALTTDINGLNGYVLKVSRNKYNTTLASGVVQTLSIPATADRFNVIFAYEPGASVWVAYNETAALPGSSFALATSEHNPTARELKGGDTISFITANTVAVVGVILYVL